jgi:hypothetical protein
MSLATGQFVNWFCLVTLLFSAILFAYGVTQKVRAALSNSDNPAALRSDLDALRMFAYTGMCMALSAGVFVALIFHK